MKEVYIYPAILLSTDGHVVITFPDFPDHSFVADSISNAITIAKKELEKIIEKMDNSDKNMPTPTDITKLTLDPQSRLLLIDIFITPIRKRFAGRQVKRILSVPTWLNMRAELQGIDLSQVFLDTLHKFFDDHYDTSP